MKEEKDGFLSPSELEALVLVGRDVVLEGKQDEAEEQEEDAEHEEQDEAEDQEETVEAEKAEEAEGTSRRLSSGEIIHYRRSGHVR